MATQSQVAGLNIKLAWDAEAESFTPTGHVHKAGDAYLVPITVPYAMLTVTIENTTFDPDPVRWIDPTPEGEVGPYGCAVARVGETSCLVYITNANLGEAPHPIGFTAVTAAGALDFVLLNMSLETWKLSAACSQQIGLSYVGQGKPLQPVGLAPGDKLRLNSPFTGVRLMLINTTWDSEFEKIKYSTTYDYEIEGDDCMSLVAFNGGQPEETLLLKTKDKEFSLTFTNGPLMPPRDSAVTLARATLTYLSNADVPNAVPELRWSGDVSCDKALEIDTPFSLLAIETVGTQFSSTDPILWLPHNSPKPPSNILVSKVSDTEYYIYNLHAAVGLFAFSINTVDGPSDPTIVNKVPIQTDIDGPGVST